MNLFLFVFALVVSFIVVRIGAIAFQLTGMEWPLAKFQALSCFSGTGFTTREAENITSDPRRRRIASLLMILGNAGLVTLIATFANTIRPRELTWSFEGLFRGLLPWANLILVITAIFLTYRFFTHSRAGARLTEYLQERVMKSGLSGPVTLEELTVATGGYGVVRVTLLGGNPLVGQALAASGLRARDITVLVIRRGSEVFANPAPETTFAGGDEIMCFGDLDRMRHEFEPEQAEEDCELWGN